MGEKTFTGEVEAEGLARDQPQGDALVFALGQIGGARNAGKRAALPRRPAGRPIQLWMPCRRWPRGAHLSAGAFAMGDAASGRHPVDVAGL